MCGSVAHAAGKVEDRVDLPCTTGHLGAEVGDTAVDEVILRLAGEIEALLAFLQWIGEMDLNGFPPKPTLLPVAVPVAWAACVDEAVATPVSVSASANQSASGAPSSTSRARSS